MEFVPEEFKNVNLNSTEESACSPESPGPSWRGIIINLPKKIFYSSTLEKGSIRMPLCGYSLNDYADMVNSEPMTAIIVNKSTDISQKAILLEEDPSPEVPDPYEEPINPGDMEGMAIGGYFNYDLQSYLPVELKPGTYDISVKYAGKVSNTATVEIIEK